MVLEALLYLLVSGGEGEGEVLKPQILSTTAMCFQSRFLGSLHSLLPNAPENNPTVFFPLVFWKWPNNCQEEECEAFPGAVHDVSAQRRPLLLRQFGYSRAHSTQIPNSWSQLLLLRSSKTIREEKKKRTVANIWVFAGLLGTLGVSCLKIKELKNAMIDRKGRFPSTTH